MKEERNQLSNVPSPATKENDAEEKTMFENKTDEDPDDDEVRY